MCIINYFVILHLQVGAGIGITLENQFLGSRKVVSLFTKSKNRGNFAALLNVELFNKETRMKSNVRGRGKERLDPEKIKFVLSTYMSNIYQFFIT